MKKYILSGLLLAGVTFSGLAQKEYQELTWEDLKVEKFEKKTSKELKTEVMAPVFSKKQSKMDSTEVIISGNYHVLNSFDSKTHLLSKDEIIKTPMQRDEVIIIHLKDDEDPIYFGRKVKLKGKLVVSKSVDDESFFSLIDAEKAK
jgi:hypothetical protein